MIKNLIFDFGNIFIDLDKEKINALLRQVGSTSLPKDLIRHNKAYEKGLISSAEHISYYQKMATRMTAEEFTTAWNSVLVDIPRSRFEFLKGISDSEKYQLLLLSNTNEMHMQWVAEHIPFYTDFKALFDHFYLSHEIHLRKPDREIFEYITTDAAILPEESLFIDDLSENTKTAKDMGFHTWTLNPKTEDVTELFTVQSNLF